MVQILHLLPCTLWEMAEGKSQWKPMFWCDIDHCFIHIKFSQAYQTKNYSVFPVNTRSQKMIHLLFFRALLLLCIFSSVWCYVWLQHRNPLREENVLWWREIIHVKDMMEPEGFLDEGIQLHSQPTLVISLWVPVCSGRKLYLFIYFHSLWLFGTVCFPYCSWAWPWIC